MTPEQADRWVDERKNGDHGNMTFHFLATAPGCGTEAVAVVADDETEAKVLAREEASDMLGVRAEHVVLCLKRTTPNF